MFASLRIAITGNTGEEKGFCHIARVHGPDRPSALSSLAPVSTVSPESKRFVFIQLRMVRRPVGAGILRRAEKRDCVFSLSPRAHSSRKAVIHKSQPRYARSWHSVCYGIR